LFIKFGDKGRWEKSWLESGVLQLGYHELDHEACLRLDDAKVRKVYPGNVR